MTNQLSAENLSTITFNQIPVITTELLARLYGTAPVRIRQSHARNRERFVEGKHYFVAKGKDLENLKVSLRYFQEITPNVRKLILWTERGAARHAKMLETDQAWEVFERLEDCYFNKLLAGQLPSHATNQQKVVVEGSAITQLNAMFLSAERLRTEMWPHLSKLIPGLDRRYLQAFETLAMTACLLKKTREECRQKAEKIMAGS